MACDIRADFLASLFAIILAGVRHLRRHLFYLQYFFALYIDYGVLDLDVTYMVNIFLAVCCMLYADDILLMSHILFAQCR